MKWSSMVISLAATWCHCWRPYTGWRVGLAQTLTQDAHTETLQGRWFQSSYPERPKVPKLCLPSLIFLMPSSFSLCTRPPLRSLLAPGELPQSWFQHLSPHTLNDQTSIPRLWAAFPCKVIKIQRACYSLYCFLSMLWWHLPYVDSLWLLDHLQIGNKNIYFIE